MLRRLSPVFATVMLITIAACGGGGSSEGTSTPQTVSISGQIFGLASGTTVTLLNNNGDPLTLNADGTFKFSTPIAYNSSYNVTIGTQPTGQICSVVSGPGTVVTADVNSVAVQCVANCTTSFSGIISADVNYGIAGSPYCVNLQIPTGITANFEPGTIINGGRIVVQGILSINGTASAPIRLTGVDIIAAGQRPGHHQIGIAHASISGGSIAPSGYSGYGSLVITDSRINNLNSELHLPYPVGTNTIARNVLTGFGGIVYDFGLLDSSNPLSLSIVNNYFGNNWRVLNMGQYGTTFALIEKNTFAARGGFAVALPNGYPNAALNASNNYWGTTDSTVIEQMIYDKHVNITTSGYIPYTPFLSAPDPGTPTP